MRVISFLLLFCFFSIARADLLISFEKESSLPYALSPNNYDNSPNNYDNSVNNYDNSPSNYDNSESNYNNSSSNLDNHPGGEYELILKDGNKSIFVGYYVTTESGLTNFFSSKGKRLFYNPGKSAGVFHGKKGYFCGVLARINDTYQLVLTEKGEKALMLAHR